jgi:hypothetical protein
VRGLDKGDLQSPHENAPAHATTRHYLFKQDIVNSFCDIIQAQIREFTSESSVCVRTASKQYPMSVPISLCVRASPFLHSETNAQRSMTSAIDPIFCKYRRVCLPAAARVGTISYPGVPAGAKESAGALERCFRTYRAAAWKIASKLSATPMPLDKYLDK